MFWDRGDFPYRRAFYSKFLILSGGQDQQPGVFLYSDADIAGLDAGLRQSTSASTPHRQRKQRHAICHLDVVRRRRAASAGLLRASVSLPQRDISIGAID